MEHPKNLSTHLSWNEFTITQHREFLEQQQNPPDAIIENGQTLAVTVFEPARLIVGAMQISSGYRCPELNVAIGGAKKSAHMDGRALDCEPLETNIVEAYIKIANAEYIPYDQLIFEYGRWIHMSIAETGMSPRNQLLMIFDLGKYLVFDQNDPRVIALA